MNKGNEYIAQLSKLIDCLCRLEFAVCIEFKKEEIQIEQFTAIALRSATTTAA